MLAFLCLAAGGMVAILLGIGSLPAESANSRARFLGRALVAACMVSAAIAGLGIAVAWKEGPHAYPLVTLSQGFPGTISLYLDSLAFLIALMISVIGAVVAQFSRNYLAGDPAQGRFLRNLSLTIGASLLLAISGHLLLFFAAWTLTSFGLHRLLIHYPDRPWAVWAARKKFLISRLGDCLLIAAMVQTFRCFGTLEYAALFQAAGSATAEGRSIPGVAWIGIFLALGAMAKSAQFPFHTWLPDTLETPTPVSALMHAGVINAGGFLVIRLSPLMVLSSPALQLLVAVGAFTALFGGLVMITQTSVKRTLAYSTISQMGFMMLQCGLGAWSAAILHLLAHSAYKACAFLSSGGVLEEPAPAPARSTPLRMLGATILAASGVAAGIVAAMSWTSSSLLQSSGGWLLLLILGLAVTQILRAALLTGEPGVIIRSLALVACMIATYAVGYRAVDTVLETASVTSAETANLSISPVLTGLIAGAFLAAFAFDAAGWRLPSRRWASAFYVHAVNGFYLDIPARRLTAWFYRQKAAVP